MADRQRHGIGLMIALVPHGPHHGGPHDEPDEDNLQREGHDDDPVAKGVRRGLESILWVLENQGPAGVRAVKRYAEALDTAADYANDHNPHHEEVVRELCDALYELRQRCEDEKRRRQ